MVDWHTRVGDQVELRVNLSDETGVEADVSAATVTLELWGPRSVTVPCTSTAVPGQIVCTPLFFAAGSYTGRFRVRAITNTDTSVRTTTVVSYPTNRDFVVAVRVNH